LSRKHDFTIVVSGVDTSSPDFADKFYEAGCDDATVAVQKGLVVLEFDREAPSFDEALLSAIGDVHETGVEIERIEPDHLVSASEMSKRADLTRAAISQYAGGRRGEGFPRPVARVTSDSPLWDWVEVAEWMHAHGGKVSSEEIDRARWVRAANNIIATLRHPDEEIEPRVARVLAAG